MGSVRRITLHYAVIQGLYWITYCLVFNFAAVFLLDKGFGNGETGASLGASYLISALLQPISGARFSRSRYLLNLCAVCVYILICALSLCLALVPMRRPVMILVIIALFSLQSMMQPTINAQSTDCEAAGIQVTKGLARGIGSATFAATCFGIGQLLRQCSPSLLPALYCASTGLLILALLPFHAGGGQKSAEAPQAQVSY